MTSSNPLNIFIVATLISIVITGLVSIVRLALNKLSYRPNVIDNEVISNFSDVLVKIDLINHINAYTLSVRLRDLLDSMRQSSRFLRSIARVLNRD